MKLILTLLGAVVALAFTVPHDAEAKRGYRKRPPYTAYYYPRPAVGYYGRPASVGPNGLCQRDTGTPTSQLNFRNKCDTEEFWNRMNRGRRL